jgi:hypothetical protein
MVLNDIKQNIVQFFSMFPNEQLQFHAFHRFSN